MRARLVAAAAAGCLVLASNAMSASAAPHSGSVQPIGGPLLGSRGLIERPLAGAPALPPRSALPASSWMVTNLTTGQVLAAKDPHGKFLPASTLKTLTALTLLSRLDPHSSFTATYKDAVVDGTRVGLVPGMTYTIAKLFTCMLTVSANDAADALAQANGGIAKTVAEMNVEAHQVQADDTHADTPSGLDGPGETTSAYDLALIAQQDYAIPAYRHYVQIINSRVPAPHHKHFAIQTHNELLTFQPYRGDIGGKNGYTVAAQATDVNAATRHGQTILITLMHANPNFWPMARALLNWGFKAYGKVDPVGTLVQPLPPAATVANTQTVSNHTLGQSSLRPGHSSRLPMFPLEVVAAAIVALGITTVGLRRRKERLRNRHYRSRLRLPPV